MPLPRDPTQHVIETLATKYRSLRPGATIPYPALWHVLIDQGWSWTEVDDAVDAGCELGYFRKEGGKTFLTEAGYEAMRGD